MEIELSGHPSQRQGELLSSDCVHLQVIWL